MKKFKLFIFFFIFMLYLFGCGENQITNEEPQIRPELRQNLQVHHSYVSCDILKQSIGPKDIRKLELIFMSFNPSANISTEELESESELVTVDKNGVEKYFFINLYLYSYDLYIDNLNLKVEFYKRVDEYNIIFKPYWKSEAYFDFLEVNFETDVNNEYASIINLTFVYKDTKSEIKLAHNQNKDDINNLYEEKLNEYYYEKTGMQVISFIKKWDLNLGDIACLCVVQVGKDDYVEKEEIIGLTFRYEDLTRILIYENERFYTLTEAYGYNIIGNNFIRNLYKELYDEVVSISSKQLYGNVYKNGVDLGKHTYYFGNCTIKLLDDVHGLEIDYLFETDSGTVEIYNEKTFKYIDNKYYEIIYGDDLSNFYRRVNKKNSYIDCPLYLNYTENELLFTEDIDLSQNQVVDFAKMINLSNKSFAELFNCEELNDEYLMKNYDVLVFTRKENSSSLGLANITYSDFFIENGDIYITKKYSGSSTDIYDDVTKEYIELILIPKDLSDLLNETYKVNYSYKYSDGVGFELLPYEYVEDIKLASDKTKYYILGGKIPPSNFEDYIEIDFVYGKYGDAIVFSFDFGEEVQQFYIDFVINLAFPYEGDKKSNFILVYYQGCIYSLGNAFDNNYITYEDAVNIYNIYKNKE